MPGPVYYASQELGVPADVVTTLSLEVVDGSKELGNFYIPVADSGLITFSITGTDSGLMDIIYDSGSNPTNTISLKLKNAANHKNKVSYDVFVTGTKNGSSSMLTVSGTVIATTQPAFTSSSSITILDGARDDIHQFATNEVAVPCTYELVTPAESNSNALVSLTSSGVLSLLDRASANSLNSYTVIVKATSPYTHWQGNADNTKTQTLTIAVTDGSPKFMVTSNGEIKADDAKYFFTTSDGLTTLSNSGHIFTTDACLFTLTGTDAALFTITPTTSGTRAKVGSLSLKNIAKYSVQHKYYLTVIATDSTSHTSNISVEVTVTSDETNPVLTLAALSPATQGTLADANTITVRDGVLANVGICTVTADESVTFSKSGTNAALFDISSTSTVATVKFHSKVAEDTQTTYTVIITATDSSNNQSSKTITVNVSDKTNPVITAYSPQVVNGETSFTNSTYVPITFTSSELLSDQFELSYFSITGPGTIDQDHFDTSSTQATIHVIPSTADADEGQLITVTLAANRLNDAHNVNNKNSAVVFKFKYDYASGVPEIVINGSNPITIPMGRPYTDAGATCQDLTVVNSNEVDVKTSGTYFVTYTVTDAANNKRSASRTVTVSSVHDDARTKPTITVTGGSSSVRQNSVFTDNASAVASANNYDNTPITIVKTNNVNTATLGNYSAFYNGTDLIFGALVQVIRAIAVTIGDPAANGGVEFTLGNLNASFTLTNKLSLTAGGSIPDTAMTSMMGVEVSMPAADWNGIFYVRPDEPTDGGNGLSDFADLASIDVFVTDTINYKTKSSNLHIIPGLATTNVTINKTDRKADPVAGTVNEINNTSQKICEVITRRWGSDIFDMELTTNLLNIFSNLNTIIAEINNKFGSTGAGTLDAALKAKLDSADNKTNADKTLDNFSRQILLQLHEAIAPNGVAGSNASRLTTGGIFNPTNKVTSGPLEGYFPITFLPTDKLTFSMTFAHPTNDSQTYYMKQGRELSPVPVPIKVVVTMT